MKAIVYEKYGSPAMLQLRDVAQPVPAAHEVLIKIHAVSINGSDKEGLAGKPLYARMDGLRRPGTPILGSDIAGTVAAVGSAHTEFKPGDELFGELPGYHGGFAEYVCADGKTLALKPPAMSFAVAAAIPQAGAIALLGIQAKGQVQAGQQVLINGAGGSAGSFAIQLAKLHGAEVTGVDNGGKLEFMRSLGADHVIDYRQQDFTKTGRQYDLILDLVARRSVFACRRALRPNGTYLLVGGKVSALLGALLLGSLVGRQDGKNIRVLAAGQSRQDLLAITALCESGQVTPIIDRQYSLAEVPEAMRYVTAGEAKGKVVINVAG